ncbi:MAG: dimethylarginine dimethylaminohydrolase family protein [Candidatus Limnocylindrales bacterium]
MVEAGGDRTYGAQSMVAPLRVALVKRPGPAFGRAFDDAAYGFFHPVDLPAAQSEHDALCATLRDLGVDVRFLDAETPSPDLVYTFDPALVTDRGAVLLRSGRPTRRGESDVHAAWYAAQRIPVIGRIEPPGTVDGGDTLWLDEATFCVGRTLRTNSAGIAQLTTLVGGDVRVFDVPYGEGPTKLIHLMSLISPVAPDLAVVYLPLLPVGLWELLRERRVGLVEVPEAEFDSLGPNILAVRPGVIVMAAGNPVTAARLRQRGVEVHEVALGEVGVNGSGGPTCLTRPVLRG